VSRFYVETSALLRALLEGDAPLRARLTEAVAVTSALTFTEAARALARARREGRLDARQAREVERWLAAFEDALFSLGITPASEFLVAFAPRTWSQMGFDQSGHHGAHRPGGFGFQPEFSVRGSRRRTHGP
jgi:predicted nucleic acid-binding protein